MLKNVLILSEGLVLQDADVWGKTLKIIGRNVSWGIKDGLSLKSTVKSVLEMMPENREWMENICYDQKDAEHRY